MELRDAGLSRSTIASTRHFSRHSVSEVFSIADAKGLSYNDVRDLEEPEVYRLFYPEKFANETMYGDPDYEHVHQELKKVGSEDHYLVHQLLCTRYLVSYEKLSVLRRFLSSRDETKSKADHRRDLRCTCGEN